MAISMWMCKSPVLALVLVCLAGVNAFSNANSGDFEASANCDNSTITQHGKNVTSCTCRGKLVADSVNQFIQDRRCSAITLANCSIDTMVLQLDDENIFSMLEVHYLLENCVIAEWPLNYLIDEPYESDYEPSGNVPSKLKYLMFKNVTMESYDGWTQWISRFDANGKLDEILRFDSSSQLILHSGRLFSDRITANHEVAIAFSNMNFKDATIMSNVRTMLSAFSRARSEMGEDDRAAFLYALYIESTQLESIPALAISVEALHEPISTLSFRGNQIQAVLASSFALYKLSKLTALDLANNQIATLQPGAFSSLTALRDLDLSSNQLTTFDSSVIDSLKSLRYVNLRNNKLTFLDWSSPPALVINVRNLSNLGAIKNDTKYGIDLYGNRWDCNCKLVAVINSYRDAATKPRVEGVFQDAPVCANGLSFLQVNADSLCSTPAITSQRPSAATATTAAVRKDGSSATAAAASSGAKGDPVVVQVTQQQNAAPAENQQQQPSSATASSEQPLRPAQLMKETAADSAKASSDNNSMTIIIVVAVASVLIVVAVIVGVVLWMKRKQKRNGLKNASGSKDTALPLMDTSDVKRSPANGHGNGKHAFSNGNGKQEQHPLV